MSDTGVVFDDERTESSNIVGNIQIVQGAPTGTIAWLVEKKIVQNAKQAEALMIIIGILATVLAIGTFIFATRTTLRHPTAAQVQFMLTEHIPSPQ